MDALEFCVKLTTCLKLPVLRAGTRSSHRLRLRTVSRVRYTYRSMAIDTPTTNIKASGYRNIPPSLKKLTTEIMKFICALLNDSRPLVIRDSTRFRTIIGGLTSHPAAPVWAVQHFAMHPLASPGSR